MDTRDGFIIGIYNYCDRWCDRCRLATRCHVYVDEQLERQGIGPSLRMCLDGSPSTPGPAGTEADDPDGSDVIEPPAPDAVPGLPPLSSDAAALDIRARLLGRRLLDWPVPAAPPADADVAHAFRVIGHFGLFLGPKVYRALIGLARDGAWNPRGDARGSAKAALIALDELEAAWLQIAEAGLATTLEAQSVFEELGGVKAGLERMVPDARDFVRPGFDEPGAVLLLELEERG